MYMKIKRKNQANRKGICSNEKKKYKYKYN